MNRRTVRPGYSLPEVLVAVVLLGIIGGALTRLVVSQMRFFDTVSTTRSARSVARNAMNLMLSELRMVQAENGVTAATSTSISVNVPYSMGVYCASASGASTVSMMPADSMVLATASFAGYAYRDPTTGLYTSVAGTTPPPTSGTPSRCTGSASGEAKIKTATINGRVGRILDVSPVIPGSPVAGMPVFLYQNITYSFAASTMFPGKTGLWRTIAGGTPEELMAPFASTARFKFYQAGDNTSSTTVPAVTAIRGIDVVLTAVSARRAAGESAESQSKMVTSVFFKNTVAQ